MNTRKWLAACGVFIIGLMLVGLRPIEASPARQTGAPTLVLAHNETIYSAEWSPDGRWILTVTFHATYIWNALQGTLFATVSHHSENLPAWSPDSTKLVTWQSDKAWVWEMATGRMLMELRFMKPVDNVTWRSDSTQIAILLHNWDDGDGEYHLWDIPTGMETLVLDTLHYSYLSKFSWSSDGHYGSSAGIGTVAFQVWDLTDGAELVELRQPGTAYVYGIVSKLTTATWSNEGDKVLVSNIQGGAAVIDVPSQTILFRITDDKYLQHVLWNANQTLLVGDTPGSRQLPVWNGQTGEFMHYLTSDWLFIDMSWSQDGKSLLTTLWDGNLSSRITVWDVTSGTVIWSVEFDRMYRALAWSAGDVFVAGSIFSDNRIGGLTQIARVANGEILLTIPQNRIVWHPSENRFLIVVNPEDDCGTDCTYEVQVWDVE